jgi:hypothetical protein
MKVEFKAMNHNKTFKIILFCGITNHCSKNINSLDLKIQCGNKNVNYIVFREFIRVNVMASSI